MRRSMVLTGAAMAGVVALAGCSSSASEAPSAGSGSGSAAAGAANDAATAGANAQFIDTQASSSPTLNISNPNIPAIVQACQTTKTNGANPVVVINYTGQEQTFNYTDNRYVAPLITFVNPSQLPAQNNCTISGTPTASSQPVTVPAGQTMVTVLTTGNNGNAISMEPNENVLSIGGGASGNSQWYDFYVHFSNSPAANSFGNWELAYQNTGGLNPSLNTQAGLLNVVECSMNSDGTITTGAAVINGTLTTLPQTTVATPYGSNDNRWQYNTGDPICLGFFDEDFPVDYAAAS